MTLGRIIRGFKPYELIPRDPDAPVPTSSVCSHISPIVGTKKYGGYIHGTADYWEATLRKPVDASMSFSFVAEYDGRTYKWVGIGPHVYDDGTWAFYLPGVEAQT